MAYEAKADSIRVKFHDGGTYLYTNASAGKKRVEEMKRLAEEGEGLSTYISQEVREHYAEKQRRRFFTFE